MRLISILALGSLALFGCTSPQTPSARQGVVGPEQSTASKSDRSAAGPQAKSTLSREHEMVIDVPEAQLAAVFQHVADRCTADVADHCTILQSDLSSGEVPSGLIQLRIDPAAVENLVAFAAAQGKLERRSTRVEDLADAIADTEARIDMLTSYRKQLLDLQGRAGNNVEAAIKIASELSTVQTELERASGQAAYQTKRTTTDILRIEFIVAEHRAFWRPVTQAGREFLGNLSNGVSQAITAVAYIVPWLFVIVPGLYLLRFLWRRRGR